MYNTRVYNTIIVPDPDIGGYNGSVPDVPGCLVRGGTLNEVTLMMKGALTTELVKYLEEGRQLPEPKYKPTKRIKEVTHIPVSINLEEIRNIFSTF